MNFDNVFTILLEQFQKYHIRFALIGGFALHANGYSRATDDIDFLIDQEDMPKVKKIMESLGYEAVHESEDVSNFIGKMAQLGRVDFLHAHRKYAKAMLQRAREVELLGGKFKVRALIADDLIGLKVQSSSNDPSRHHLDMADIESLMKVNYAQIDLNLIREYFQLFDREKELDEILERINHAP